MESVNTVKQATARKRVNILGPDECTRRLAMNHEPNLGKVKDGLEYVPDEIPDAVAR